MSFIIRRNIVISIPDPPSRCGIRSIREPCESYYGPAEIIGSLELEGCASKILKPAFWLPIFPLSRSPPVRIESCGMYLRGTPK